MRITIKDGHVHEGHTHAGGVEPHIWNSTINAQIIAGNILNALCAIDKANESVYMEDEPPRMEGEHARLRHGQRPGHTPEHRGSKRRIHITGIRKIERFEMLKNEADRQRERLKDDVPSIERLRNIIESTEEIRETNRPEIENDGGNDDAK